jgi:RNA polymerase sigma-70 factor (ECF subfamily)
LILYIDGERILEIMTIMDDSINPEKLLKHSGWMKSLAVSLVRDDAAAHDVVQQTWLAALKKPPRSLEAAGAWLRKVVRNFALRTRQEERHRAKREQRAARPEKVTSTPAELLQRVELQREIADAITRLEEPYRSVVLLRYFEELSVTEIARRHGIPVTTVSSRLAKALEQLRVRLDRKHGGSRQAWCLILLPLARSKEAAAAAAVTSTAIPGTLVLKGVAMKATLKIAAIVTPIIVAGALLTVGGVLPESLMFWGSGEEPLAVSFQPITEEQPNGEAVAEVETQAAEEPAARETVAPTEPAVAAEVPTTAKIKAKIVDQRGNPLKGALLREVTLEGPEATAASDRSGRVELTLETTERGRGAHVEACLHGYVSYVERIRAFAGRTTHLGTIELLPGGAIRGRVHDSEGRGIAGAVITTDTPDEHVFMLENKRFWEPRISVPAVRTDAFGGFVLTGLDAGYVRLWARAEGWLPNYTAAIEIQEGQETLGVEITIDRLGPENQVRGRVVDPDGTPVPFAKLNFGIHSDAIGYTRIDFGKANEDGSFDYLVAEGTWMGITAIDPKGRYGAASAERVDAGELNLELRLTAGESVRLIALGEKREQIERFKFEVLSSDEELTLQEGWRGGDPMEVSGAGVAGVSSGASSGGENDAETGTFYRLPAEDYLVRVTAPLHQVQTMGPFRPKEIEDLLEVHLRPLPGIHGKVLIDGKPVRNAQVRLHKLVPEDKSILRSGFKCWLHPIAIEEVRTDADGRFVLTPRKAGGYVVRTEVKGFAPAEYGPVTIDPELALDPVVLELGPGGIIEGRVIPPLGEDPTGTVVAINRGDGRPQNVRVGPEGTFRFTHLVPGSWCVEPRDEEMWQIYTQTSPKMDERDKEIVWNCEVDEGKTTYYDLYVDDPDAVSLSGVMTLDGEPLAGWFAWLCPPDAF